MKKRDWFILSAVIFTFVFIDHFTKVAALDLKGSEVFGPFVLALHFNPGAILGYGSDLPAVLRIVSFSTGGAFLIFLFFIANYLLPGRIMLLRVGMAGLLGGILGNVTDRIFWGKVVDFIIIDLPFGWGYSPAFNVADALQWVGYGLVAYFVIKDGEKIWPKVNSRKVKLVNPKFQLKYAFTLSLFALCFGILAGTLSFTYLKVTMDTLVGESASLDAQFLYPFIITFVLVTAIFCSIMFFVGILLSNKSAGPLYAFEKFIEDLILGKTRGLKLRTGDEFLELEHLAEKLKKKFSESEKKVS